MTTFDDREHAAEAKYIHEEELMFRAHARRDHQFGLWAGQLMGKMPAESQAYAELLVSAEITMGGQNGQNSIATRVRSDLAAAGIVKSDTDISAKMEMLLAEALAQLRRTI